MTMTGVADWILHDFLLMSHDVCRGQEGCAP